ncbi:MAG: SDR family NAD(P)-dependent oxidoreductase [Deltaproteobacteria bacterium]|nr:SDR family NAD(P)-dependent oxidoreductase [Deltaproteobacteria bacterium]
MKQLSGRVALVTGGGRGIGRAIALEFARQGAKVAVASRTRSELDSVVGEIRELGAEGLALPCDVMDRSAIKGTVATVIERCRRLDVLVNNAGGVYYKKLEDIMTLTHDDQLFEDHLFFNLTSAYYATRAALPQMVEQNYGRIIFIGSGYAKMGGGPLAYTAGKHGLVGMTRAMAHQLPPTITVNTLCPAWTNTKLANDYFDEGSKALGTTAAALKALAEADNVQKRLIEPEELGPMAALIASEDGGRAITGQVISVDGGYKI